MAVATASSFRLTLADTEKSVNSFPLSLKFMKKLVSVSLSTVISRRFNNEPSNFHHHTYKGVDYYLVKKTPKETKFKSLFNSIHGIREAIENQYLKGLHLIIVEGINSDNVLEKYKYKFKYSKEGVEASETRQMRKQVFIAVTKHLTDIEVLQQFPRLPEDAVFHIFLTYYDNTPKDYEPFFFNGKGDKTHFIIDELLCNEKRISFEKVFTGFHSVSCSARIKELPTEADKANENAIIEEENTEINKKQDNERQLLGETTISIPSNGGIDDSWDLTLCNETSNFNCICGISDKIIDMETVICSLCHSYFHHLCVSLLIGKLPDRFVCLECAEDMPNVKPSNILLATLEKEQRETLVIRILILYCILKSESYPEDIINKLSEAKRYDVVCFFEENGLVAFQEGNKQPILDLKAIESYFDDVISKTNEDDTCNLPESEELIPAKRMKKGY